MSEALGRVRRGDVSAMATRIIDDFNLDPEGGVLSVVVGTATRADELAALLRTRLQTVSVVLHSGGLVQLNAQRDRLSLSGTIALVMIDSVDDVGELLISAPDLNDWIESISIIEAERVADAEDAADTAQYLARLGEECAQLDLTGLVPGFTQEWRLPLDSVYMELAREDMPASPLPRLLIFVGHPGTGKTTMLRHKVVELARRGLKELQTGRPDEIPILVPAAGYARALSKRIRSFSEFLIEELEARGYRAGRNLLSEAATRGCACVCIDALDEVPGDLLKSVAEGIAEFANSTQARILITSRPAHLVFLTRTLQSFARVILGAPNPTQIDDFISNFLDAHAEATGSNRVKTNAEDLKLRLRQPDLARLTETPLTLTFLVLLHVVEGRLPERRVSLYHRLAELLVERWNIARSLAGPRASLPYGEALRLFAPLAWWLLRQRPSGYVAEPDLIHQMTNQLVDRGETKDTASRLTRDFLDRMRRDMLILLPTEHGEWCFFHPTVAEYLAGVELSRNHKLRRSIIQRRMLFNPELREMLLFCAGELGTVRADDESLQDLVRSVLAQSSRAGRYDSRYASLLVGLLVEDVGMIRGDEIALIHRIAAFASDYVYSYHERGIVDADILRALSLVNERNRSIWREALLSRFVEPVNVDSVEILLKHAFVISGDYVIGARLLLQLPAHLERLSLSPLPLLKHLVALSNPLGQVIGRSASALCSEPVRQALL